MMEQVHIRTTTTTTTIASTGMVEVGMVEVVYFRRFAMATSTGMLEVEVVYFRRSAVADATGKLEVEEEQEQEVHPRRILD